MGAMALSSRLVLPQLTSSVLVDYTLEEFVGEGTYGSVRVCRRKATGERLACKIIGKQKLQQKEDVKLLRQEIEAMRELRGHPSIMDLKAVYEDHEAVYLVMELCEGGDLLDKLSGPGRLEFSETEAAQIFYQVAEAVALCHNQGWCHRDVKPDNVMFLRPVSKMPRIRLPSSENLIGSLQTGAFAGSNHMGSENSAATRSQSWSSAKPCGNSWIARQASLAEPLESEGVKPMAVKLGDFGLAARMRPGEIIEGVAGSCFYLAPEMVRDEVHGLEADVWSLGVLLYAILSQQLPFCSYDTVASDAAAGECRSSESAGRRRLYNAICKGRPDTWSGPWHRISEPAKQLIHRMLSVDRLQRITANDILHNGWLRSARATLRPELVFTLSRTPAYLPLSDMRKAHAECTAGLGCLTVAGSWKSSAPCLAEEGGHFSLSCRRIKCQPGVQDGASADASSVASSSVTSVRCSPASSGSSSPEHLSPPALYGSSVKASTSASRLGYSLRLQDFALDYRPTARS